MIILQGREIFHSFIPIKTNRMYYSINRINTYCYKYYYMDYPVGNGIIV